MAEEKKKPNSSSEAKNLPEGSRKTRKNKCPRKSATLRKKDTKLRMCVNFVRFRFALMIVLQNIMPVKSVSQHEIKKFELRTNSFFPGLVYFLLTAFLILVIGIFFQIQLTSLQQELANLKINISGGEGERPRNMRKRSSAALEKHDLNQNDIQAAYLQGIFPFQHIQKQGRIGPWFVSSTEDSFINLKGKNTEIEIGQNGIYYVYAQVYYLTSHLHNSFQIMSYNGTEDRKHHRNLATCSSQGRNSIGEASCYTGFIGSFHTGQRLYLNQIEQDRIIHFTNGCSYFGVVLLKQNATLKRKT